MIINVLLRYVLKGLCLENGDITNVLLGDKQISIHNLDQL